MPGDLSTRTPRSPTASTCERGPTTPCCHFRAIPGTAPTRVWSEQSGVGREIDLQCRRLARNRGLLPVRPLRARVKRRRVRPPTVMVRPTGLAGPRVGVRGTASPRRLSCYGRLKEAFVSSATAGFVARQGGSADARVERRIALMFDCLTSQPGFKRSLHARGCARLSRRTSRRLHADYVQLQGARGRTSAAHSHCADERCIMMRTANPSGQSCQDFRLAAGWRRARRWPFAKNLRGVAHY